jgi:hypothetical protein
MTMAIESRLANGHEPFYLQLLDGRSLSSGDLVQLKILDRPHFESFCTEQGIDYKEATLILEQYENFDLRLDHRPAPAGSVEK